MKQFKTEYMRKHMESNSSKKPKRNNKNRVRNVHYNFHVTQEEFDMIMHRIDITGMSRREFMLNACLDNEITAIGNVKTFNKIQGTLDEVINKLNELTNMEELDDVTLQKIKNIVDVYAGLK